MIVACQKETLNDLSPEGKSEISLDSQASFRDGDDSNPSTDLNFDQDIILLSKAIAKVQQHDEVITFINEKLAVDHFQAGIVFLIEALNEPVTESKSFGDYLDDELVELGNEPNSSFLDKIILDHPTICFSLYHPDRDGVQDGIFFGLDKPTIVLPETENFSNLEEEFELSYDVDGQPALVLSNNEEPNVPVITLYVSTRYVAFRSDTWDVLNPLKRGGPRGGEFEPCDEFLIWLENLADEIENTPQNLVNDPYGFIVPNPEYDILVMNYEQAAATYEEICVDDDGSGDDLPVDDDRFTYRDGDPCIDQAQRNTRQERELLTEMSIQHSSLKKFCKWGRRWCKVGMRTAAPVLEDSNISTQVITKFYEGKRRYMKDGKTFDVDENFFKYEYQSGNMADSYVIGFVGEHPKDGNEVTIKIKISAAPSFEFDIFGLEVTVNLTALETEVEWKIKKNDLPLGEELVYYCDEANGDGTEYSTGILDFNMKEEED